MGFKFTRTDAYLIGLYLAFAIPINFMDYAEYSDADKWKLFAEVAIFAAIELTSLYVFVFIIVAKFFPTKQYVLLFASSIILFFVMGIIYRQGICLLWTCKGSFWSLSSLYYGMANHLSDISLLVAILLAKKVYDAQFHYTKLEKEKKESELRFLKSQIDPHFLFNNLNTVDALIDQDPQKAKTYINKLSKLYRYLISTKDFEVVPLKEELEFAQNYVYLIESRYGKAYQFDFRIEQKEQNMMIPPGSLQTLLENIVKHNQASETHPVRSEITVSETGITVINDLRAKNNEVDSTGIGLENLKARYQLLTDKAMKVHSNGKFTVELPLIKEVD